MKKVLTLVYLTILHTIALLFFSNGFLLTRISLTEVTEDTAAVFKPSFTKAVIIVIDALRYDFVTPQAETSAYWNHFPVLSELASSTSSNAILSKFIADPPTTTLQRLKGLTTGSLPTFVDAGSNFAGDAITEDNLVSTLGKAGKRIAFVGDDTWQALFPTAFLPHLNYPYESLNVWDLDTVDDGVYHHLFGAPDAFFSEETRKDWDVVIAHALGLDHSGHRYGPDHTETTRKLKQMDSWVRKIVSEIDSDTLLVVMGDHGMNPQGDHGGDSPEELNAALFMYAKNGHFTARSQEKADAGVAQIDFVSTFSLLMGLPIPFNNLGSPIPEAFYDNRDTNYSTAIATTAHQMKTYIRAYSQHSQAIKQSLDLLDPGSFADLAQTVQWQKDVLAIFRRQWAQYDLLSIIHGLVLMVITLIFNLILFLDRDNVLLEIICPTIHTVYTLGASLHARQSLSTHLAATVSITSIFGFVMFLYFKPCQSAMHDFRAQSTGSIYSVSAFSFLLLHCAAFASNSFTIHEDRISLLILSSFCLLLLCIAATSSIGSGKEKKDTALHIALFMCLSRVAASIRLCREEQMGSCTSTFYDTPPYIVYTAYLLVVWLLIHYVRIFLANDLSRDPWTQTWLSTGLYWPLLLICLFWFLESQELWINLANLKMTSARLFTIVCLGLSIAWYWLPLPVTFKIDRGVLTANGLANVRGTMALQVVLPLTMILVLLGRASGSLSLTILTLQLCILTKVLSSAPLRHHAGLKTSILVIGIMTELGFLHFFSTGHQMALPFIQWDLAFLVSRSIIYPISPMLVAGNAFGSFVITILWLPAIVLWRRSTTQSGELRATAGSTHALPADEAKRQVMRALAGMSLVSGAILFSTMCFATHFRRHLMVWKIFAPRFMCATLILLTVDTFAVLVMGLLSVGELKLGKLRKLFAAGSS